jgi:hypothetical protein
MFVLDIPDLSTLNTYSEKRASPDGGIFDCLLLCRKFCGGGTEAAGPVNSVRLYFFDTSLKNRTLHYPDVLLFSRNVQFNTSPSPRSPFQKFIFHQSQPVH